MKRVLIAILIIGSISSCDNFDEVREEFPEFRVDEAAAQRVFGTWRMDRIVFDFLDVTTEYEGFILSFSEDGTWSATNGDPLFASSGEFELTSETQIVFDGAYAAEINFPIDDDQNAMTMFLNPSGNTVGSRTEGLDGDYTIEFSKQ